jgi:hypothetical protein
MCVLANRFVEFVAMLGWYVAGFVSVGTQYRPPFSAAANDAAERTAMAPIAAALAIC